MAALLDPVTLLRGEMDTLTRSKPASSHHSSPSDELTYQWHDSREQVRWQDRCPISKRPRI